ncbi:hypothetical protein [Vibrio barjaei]|nr:hypothetical protein [Vibrio barjaei]MCY9871804.1 hypothetical protein [Vibrio barjaei]
MSKEEQATSNRLWTFILGFTLGVLAAHPATAPIAHQLFISLNS